MEAKAHLKSCDADGYCNNCGFQDNDEAEESAQQTIEQFISKHGLNFECKRVESRPDGLMDSEYMTRHFKCRIFGQTEPSRTTYAKVKNMSLYFSQGSGHKTDPTLADVLDCLASDASGYESATEQVYLETTPEHRPSFECWASDYGYDTDSRKAEKTYKAIKRQAEQLKRTLGQAAYEELLYNTERE
jgi:hypothetical protein